MNATAGALSAAAAVWTWALSLRVAWREQEAGEPGWAMATCLIGTVAIGAAALLESGLA